MLPETRKTSIQNYMNKLKELIERWDNRKDVYVRGMAI